MGAVSICSARILSMEATPTYPETVLCFYITEGKKIFAEVPSSGQVTSILDQAYVYLYPPTTLSTVLLEGPHPLKHCLILFIFLCDSM